MYPCFFLALFLLMAYFVNVKWIIAAPVPLLAMFISYKKGKGEV